MYCPSCGKEIGAGLSYCNHCGSRLSSSDPRALPSGSFNFLLATVIATPFIGVALVLCVMAALKNGMGFKDDMIFAVAFLTFLLFAIAEIGCVIMLLTRTRGVKPSKGEHGGHPRDGYLADQPLRSLNTGSFEPIPVGSVTDHTTRHLDPALKRDQDS